MATNPYSYGSLGQRWTVGEPTSKSLLDVSRVKADANRWALEQLIVDPDDTANFVLTAPGLNIDSNTLYVDSAYNTVGFRLSNPNDYAFDGTPNWVASGGAGPASVIIVSGTTSTGYLAFADGTTGTDRYSGNIQYNHGTNTMSFRTNGGVEAMTINSAQDLAVDGDTLYVDASADAVGISTTSPQAALHIDGTGGASNTTSQLQFSLDGTTEGIFGVASFANNIITGSQQGDTTIRNDGGNIHFSTDSGSSIAATIDTSGNVGLSVTPSATMHSNNSAYLELPNNVFRWSRSTGSFQSSNFYYNTSDSGVFAANGYALSHSQNTTGGAFYWNISTASNSSGAGAAASLSTKMYLDSTGLGLGTTSPTSRLHIIGSNGDPSAAHSGSAQLILENNANTFLEIATGAAHYAGLTFSDGTATTGAVLYDHGTGLGGGADSLHFQTAGSLKAVITSAGLLGVGTVSPEAPLEVVADPTQGYAVYLEAAASGTQGAALRGKGSYSVADAGTQTFTVGNGTIVMISDNNTGDGAMFFCGYKGGTVTLVADPNSRYANSVTASKISLTKSANTGTVTLTNNSGATRSFTILKIMCSD